ncbi:TetR/AcrR family transcriptional regulator [Phenylobacterium sp.]|uniref:TetR/AcrR family transcriptional regulator n=1 Tax=Phenylobacterium sp. TaxID=1871053 RepID=UPI00286B6A7E|nr:TetR/AcrR family transcriptional regulator [Phenylobacterium sp.]
MGRPAEKQSERRQDVAQAALRVIAREGLERASMRAIAAELGATLGVLTHYFPNKDALLRLILETVGAEIREAFDSVPLRRPADLHALIGEILPVDGPRRNLWKIWLSFAVAAADSPALAREHAREYGELTVRMAAALTRLAPQLRANLQVQAEAETLICLMDGVGLHGALMPERMPPSRQRAILKAHIDALARKETASHA